MLRVDRVPRQANNIILTTHRPTQYPIALALIQFEVVMMNLVLLQGTVLLPWSSCTATTGLQRIAGVQHQCNRVLMVQKNLVV